jgi:hypothetical protein
MSQLLQTLTKIAGSVAAVAVTTTIFPLAASAVTTTFSDSSSFESNIVPGYYLENFNFLNQGALANSLTFSQGGFTYSVEALGGLYSGTGNTGSPFIGTNNTGDTTTITFTSGNVTAVGGNFFLTDGQDNLAAGAITLTLNDGSFLDIIATTTSTPFGGFTTDGSLITSLTFTSDPSAYGSFDNFYVGTSSTPTAVPEPFTILGTIFGAGYGVVLKRKLTKSQQDKTDIT